MLGFGFLSNLPAFATWSGLEGKWAVWLTFNITDDCQQIVPNCFYSAISVRLEVIH